MLAQFLGDSHGFDSPMERHTCNGGRVLRACKTPASPSWHRDAHCHRRLDFVSPFTRCSHVSCQCGAVAAFFGRRPSFLLCYEDLHRIPPLGFHGFLVLDSLACLFSLQHLGSSKIMRIKVVLPKRN